MKVILLGGAGYFGRTVITDYSSRLPAECEFVIADYDYKTARKMVKKLGERFSARMIDAADPRSLEKSLEGASLAVSFIGPWYRFGELIVEHFLRSEKPLVITNTGLVDVSAKLRERLARSRVRCVTGISLIPGAITLLTEEIFNRHPGCGEIVFTLEVDTVRSGGLAFIREYFNLLSRDPDPALFGDVEKRVSVTFNPSGIFQKIAVRGGSAEGGIKIELLAALQEMMRKKPAPGGAGGVTLTVSYEAGKERTAVSLPEEQLFPLLSGMLAGATSVALETGAGGLITPPDMAKNPEFRKYVEKELQELIEPQE